MASLTTTTLPPASAWRETYRRFLSRLSGFRDLGDARGRAHCPLHNSEADLWLSVGTRGRLIVRCYPTSSGVPACRVDEVVRAVGLTMDHLFPLDQPPPEEVRCAGRGTENMIGGHAMRNGKDHGKAVVEGVFAYEDCTPDGQWFLAYEVVKKRFTDGSKTFTQRRPNPVFDSDRRPGPDNPEWCFDLAGKVRRVLYRMRELRAAMKEHSDRWVWVTEGELDVETALELGLVATSCSGGAMKWTEPWFKDEFRGHNVLLVPDEDPLMPPGGDARVSSDRWVSPGVEHVKQVARDILPVAKSVRVLRFPEPAAPGWDLTDWRRRQAGTVTEVRDRLRPLVDCAIPIRTVADLDRLVPRTFPGVPVPGGDRLGTAVDLLTGNVAVSPEVGVVSHQPGRNGTVGAIVSPNPVVVSPVPLTVSSPSPVPLVTTAVVATRSADVAVFRSAPPTLLPAVREVVEFLSSLEAVAEPPRSIAEWLGEVWLAAGQFQAGVNVLPNDPLRLRELAVQTAAVLLRGLDSVPEFVHKFD